MQRRLRAAVVRSVGGLAGTLQIREAEERERALVRRALAHGLLQVGTTVPRVSPSAKPESARSLETRCRAGRAPRGRPGFPEHSAEQGDGGGRDRRRRRNQDPRASHLPYDPWWPWS